MVRHHKNVSAVSLCLTARRRLETSRMNSRSAIYLLNAVLKRRADAQFDQLVAEKATAAQTQTAADLQPQLPQEENDQACSRTREVNNHAESDEDTGVVLDIQPGDANADACTSGDPSEEGSAAGTPEREAEHVAHQRSLLEGMQAAGVLTNAQCETAVAKLIYDSESAAETSSEHEQ